ncbi:MULTISPECIES: hypothetical protein [Halorubrum]|uniref:Uncharacterized protein n=1 Tax=Halorubrum ezzemoulense TaxID=337243 RepID=A0A256KIJ5_HALEZ|nr:MULTISPECIES: hypothetical protein [Halorubrum]OYR76922.1 hypothetical protein DJ77_08260 [Halorubrum ezzemoulense]OYR81014.1 hypothetical protein DJ84_14285 [Halorubrum ezzemoulense]PHQ40854.1 hypothetical protein Z052_17995 [Halorubrum sp. C191]QAY20010.1 hypothetical protein EO776_08270 [Halorubrum ezzemoulense]
MGAETAAPAASPRAWLAGLVRRTVFAVRAALGRRDGRATAGAVTGAYLIAYHLGLGHLGLRAGAVESAGTPRFDLVVAADPVALATRRVAPFQYEPVALLSAGPVEYLFAPVNAALGLALAVLVGVTLAVSVVAWRGPSACRIGAGAGVAAGLPGILSGVACCGPAFLAVIGLQASAGLLAAFRWFMPASVAGLLLTLLWVGSRVDPGAVG